MWLEILSSVISIMLPQVDMLYVHDPMLLHHILVKVVFFIQHLTLKLIYLQELDIFEEQDLFIEYVSVIIH